MPTEAEKNIPPNLDVIVAEIPPCISSGENNSDGIPQDTDTLQAYINQKDYDEHRLNEEQIKDKQQDREQRKEYADKIFFLVATWLILLLILLLFCGSGVINFSDTVIVAILTGTTLDILGFMIIVANYLFPKNGKS